MPRPRVTVLMPVHNGERYLRAAVDSVLGQTFRDFELIAVDDGSTDRSPDILASYRDPRVSTCTLSRVGFAKALNVGLDLSRGDYVARMDCDDVSLPKRLERQVAFMDSDPSIDISGSAVLAVRSSGASERWAFPLGHEEARVSLLFEPPLAHPTVVFRRKSLIESGLEYDGRYRYAEDYDLWVRAARRLRLANLAQPLLRYRVHDDRMSARRANEQRRSGEALQGLQLAELGLDEHPLRRFHAPASFTSFEGRDCSAGFLSGVASWFSLLRSANAERGLYDPEILETFLARRLLLLCSINRRRRAEAMQVLWRGPWRRRLSGWQAIRFLTRVVTPAGPEGA